MIHSLQVHGGFSLRKFVLHRHSDISGFSGTGIVAEGVEFTNGRVCMCWLSRQTHSLVIHENITEVEHVHGHNGATTVEWIDEEQILNENYHHSRM